MAAPPPRHRRVWIAGVVAAAVLVFGTIVGVILVTGGSDDPPPPAAGAPVVQRSTESGSSTAPTEGRTTDPPTTAAPTQATTTAPPVAATQAYDAPGGLTVQGPVGWVADLSAANDNIRDFRAPSSVARLAGATFRIGVGNVDPSGPFADEVTQSADFLVRQQQATIVSTSFTSFLGTTAGDIEYTYFNTQYGVQRHGVERIWRSGAVTLIIQSSDVASAWPAASALFQQLTRSASVS